MRDELTLRAFASRDRARPQIVVIEHPTKAGLTHGMGPRSNIGVSSVRIACFHTYRKAGTDNVGDHGTLHKI